MNEQQVNELLTVLKALTVSQLKQAEALNRLAMADETLHAFIVKTLADEMDDDPEDILMTYMNGKPR